jgi:hypothetical protein
MLKRPIAFIEGHHSGFLIGSFAFQPGESAMAGFGHEQYPSLAFAGGTGALQLPSYGLSAAGT